MHWRAPTFTLLAIGIWAVSALTVPLPESPGSSPSLSLSSRAAIAPPAGLHRHLLGDTGTLDRRPLLRDIVGKAEWMPTAVASLCAIDVLAPLPATALLSLAPVDRSTAPSASDALLSLATRRAEERADSVVAAALDETATWSEIEPFDQRRGSLTRPIDGSIAIPFGPERLPDLPTSVRHPGLSYRAAPGTDVTAVARGIVRYAGEFYGYGGVVVVDHGRAYHSVYAYLDDVSAHVGQVVEARERIGDTDCETSDSQSCLYFELRHLGDPVDPTEWFATQP